MVELCPLAAPKNPTNTGKESKTKGAPDRITIRGSLEMFLEDQAPNRITVGVPGIQLLGPTLVPMPGCQAPTLLDPPVEMAAWRPGQTRISPACTWE